LVQVALTPEAFRAAVEAYVFAAPPVAVSRTAALLVANAHGAGAAREQAVLYELVRATGAGTLAFEWSHDELGELLDDFMRTGRFDLQRLWRLPDGAETFSGDGRFTAGHVALLERLHREDALYGVLPFDRLDPDPVTEAAERDEEMARRLLAGWDRALPLLAVVGAAHAPQLGAALGVEPASFDYGREVQMPSTAVRFAVPLRPAAVVPGR